MRLLFGRLIKILGIRATPIRRSRWLYVGSLTFEDILYVLAILAESEEEEGVFELG